SHPTHRHLYSFPTRRSSDLEDINLTDYSTVNNTVTHDIRLLLGRILGTTEDFYWEYGNKKLGNRHLLITGKSGQGKTYFLQTLLDRKSTRLNSSHVSISYAV